MPSTHNNQPPTPQAMQMSAAAPPNKQIITDQPKSHPAPQMTHDGDDGDDGQLNLRGGGFTIGCNCCRGMFSFHKRCC
ncbi:Putative protein of unknown function [Podospora comata]|uniref:Uncharacterized protein n=1 Tax=Podospora comata TaxID=48703 RepID=A0ABY6S8C0_PODCO|nr:Putative protein of unknown function [Podospora comata]